MKYEIREVASALAELLECQARERAYRESYPAGAWDYRGVYLRDAAHAAGNRFGDLLNAIIDTRIEAKLKLAEQPQEQPK